MSDLRKVPPSPSAPQVSRRRRRRLAEADAKSAAGYDALEEATAKLAQLADELERNEPPEDAE